MLFFSLLIPLLRLRTVAESVLSSELESHVDISMFLGKVCESGRVI